jgi:rubrerythrin
MRSLHELLVEAANRQEPDAASRRHVLAALGIAAAAPVALGANAALAQVKGEGKNNNNKKKNRRNKRKKGKQGDIAVLNYALTLEHLEYAFYRDGLAQFDNDNDFNNYPISGSQLRARFLEIRDHEKTHVDTLIDVIKSLGGNPVAEACYEFGYGQDVSKFIDVAQLLENTGVMAYDGAIASIKSGDLQTAGATIATVEARHASFLNFINGDSPFPDAFDTPKSQDEILAAAGGFIVACS